MNQAVTLPEHYPYDKDNVPYFDHLFKISGSRATNKQRTNTWFVTVDEEEGSFTTHAGQLGGKLTSKKTKVKPKNTGRANATTVAEQAHIEAKAKWVHKVERELYKRDLEDGMAPLYLKCMLALDAAKYPHRIHWDNRSYFTQPKLNGVRFIAEKLAEGNVRLTSRKGTFYNVPHIQAAINKVMEVGGVPLDGELYLGEEYELGDVTHALKKGTENHLKLQAHLFDLVHHTAPGLKRYVALKGLFESRIDSSMPIKLVPAVICESAQELDQQHDEWAAKGFEGIMIRDVDGLYDYGEKNEFLYKYKKFQDQEFKIVGVIPDKDELGGLFVLETDNSEFVDADQVFEGEVTVSTFNCRSKGTDAQRAHVLAHPDEYIGKLLTVRFSEKLKTGVPEFNRGITKDGMIAVRDYE